MAYFTVFHLLGEAAEESKPCAEERHSSSTDKLQTKHYMQEFTNILFNKLTSHGIPFERDKKFKRRGKEVSPDIWITDIAFVQVKKDTGDIEDDEQMMLRYKAATGHPGILVLFTDNGGYEIKEI